MLLSFGAVTGALGWVVKTGGLIVLAMDEVVVRWATGLKLEGLGGMKKGESSGSASCEDECAPSNAGGEIDPGAGVSSSSGAGDTEGCLMGESGEGLRGRSYWLASLVLREGEAGMLRLLDGLAKGLDGRSAA